MSKKIVVLNGSPRKNGNTSALVREFTRGAREAGHTVTEFFSIRWISMGVKGALAGIAARNAPACKRMICARSIRQSGSAM